MAAVPWENLAADVLRDLSHYAEADRFDESLDYFRMLLARADGGPTSSAGWNGVEIGERQSFLTSQNPLLMDYLWFESIEEVRSTFVVCRSHRDANGREQLEWRNFTIEEATMFFDAYRAGIERVGEILRLRGMW